MPQRLTPPHTQIDFTRSNLAGTNFFNAFVTGSNFEGADLSGARHDEVTGSS